MAEALVNAEHAVICNQNGKVKAIQLVVVASNSAERIGEPLKPTGPTTVRFVRRELRDSGAVVWAFHKRSFERLV